MATETFQIESTLDQSEAFGRLVDLSQVSEWDHGVMDCTTGRRRAGNHRTRGTR